MDFNPLGVIQKLFRPIIEQSAKWPPVLAYGVPGIIAVLIIIVLGVSVRPSLVALLAIVILAPLAAYIALDWVNRLKKREPPGPPKPATGVIISPQSNSTVMSGTIHCNGSAWDVGVNQHVWLAVEADGHIWPKDGEIFIDRAGKWTHIIFEDGAATAFDLALYVATEEGHDEIIGWLNEGKQKDGDYRRKKTFSGTRRLHRVEKLKRLS